MSKPLWDKGGDEADAAVQRFCAADDVVLDREIFSVRHRGLRRPRQRPRGALASSAKAR
jgi:hypothetical protein